MASPLRQRAQCGKKRSVTNVKAIKGFPEKSKGKEKAFSPVNPRINQWNLIRGGSQAKKVVLVYASCKEVTGTVSYKMSPTPRKMLF